MNFRKMIMTILKICGALVLLAIIVTASSMGYNEYLQYEKKQAELNFDTSKSWEWHQEWDRIQINVLDDDFVEDKSRSNHNLRKVFISDKYYVSVHKDSDYELIVAVIFITNCKPNSTIVTSAKYNNGKPMKLYCMDDGRQLLHMVKLVDTDIILQKDLDGFKYRVDFSKWDFSILDKEITLLKAKPEPIDLVFEGDDDEQQ